MGFRTLTLTLTITLTLIKRNITNLGPLVLPVSEQVKFFLNVFARRAVRGKLPLGPPRDPNPNPNPNPNPHPRPHPRPHAHPNPT